MVYTILCLVSVVLCAAAAAEDHAAGVSAAVTLTATICSALLLGAAVIHVLRGGH
jgi:hypothetical protein